MAGEKETSLIPESRDRGKILGQRPGQPAAEFRRIMKLTRPTSVPKAALLFAYRDAKLLSLAFYASKVLQEDED